ncbi:MAG: hypothetical protein MI794_04620, partial [Pseudomonadales bacterium]|nr:hypothetical protein [Pseudomonadales bacterium]
SENARIHVYIGLIQVHFGLGSDAAASFAKSIEYDPALELPRGAPKRAQSLFRQIKARKVRPKRRPKPKPKPKAKPKPKPSPPRR